MPMVEAVRLWFALEGLTPDLVDRLDPGAAHRRPLPAITAAIPATVEASSTTAVGVATDAEIGGQQVNGCQDVAYGSLETTETSSRMELPSEEPPTHHPAVYVELPGGAPFQFSVSGGVPSADSSPPSLPLIPSGLGEVRCRVELLLKAPWADMRSVVLEHCITAGVSAHGEMPRGLERAESFWSD